VSGRVWASAQATLAGWFAAMMITLIYEGPELWRNAAPSEQLHDLAAGLGLWAAFTLLVCAGVWCAVVLPLTLALPAAIILRWRWPITAAASIGAILFIGWRMGTWGDLFRNGAGNPLTGVLFLNYAGFGFTLAFVTTIVYARLLRAPSGQGMYRARYGIDAPGLVLGFLFSGFILSVLGFGLRYWANFQAWASWLAVPILIASAYALGMCAYMLWGSLVVKVRGRDGILDLVQWMGHERVLDVGCGRGLLLVGAAHRLTTGKSIGVDLWLAQDQSSNRPNAPLENAGLEGVEDRVSVETADMRELPFPDASFDVVVSSWAVHNVEIKPDREKVLAEMVRVLKPGGTILLNDIVNRDEYEQAFKRLGLTDVRVVIASRWSDAISGFVSFGSFRPATVVGRRGKN
jgi:SAM-dependent methyltransferase